MRLLQQQGPARDYYPESAKSIFFGYVGSLDRAMLLLMEFDFQYTALEAGMLRIRRQFKIPEQMG